MNRVFSSAAGAAIVKSLLVASLAFAGSAFAADAAHGSAVKADPAKGGSLYDTGDNARGLPACAAPTFISSWSTSRPRTASSR
jgi:hypothetical protein